ncbi:cardiolipin synthase [Eupransor demetentiae]|uniref:cardiolipin synthase n=1 Tax=Eupransor demetentiae TaxID=3109584 RepID=UPI0032E35B04
MLSAIFILFSLNTILALITVFRQPRDIAATWAWMLVLIFVPILGFLIYAFAGRKLPKKRLFRYQEQNVSAVRQLINEQLDRQDPIDIVDDQTSVQKARTLITLFNTMEGVFLAEHNDFQLFTDGNRMFDQMMADLKRAQDTIHIEFYTFANDQLGRQIRDILVERARAGVKVHVIYDSFGSFPTLASFFKPLREAGGHAEPFLRTHSFIFDFRLNFRDHRKMVIVDGEVGYIGGFNIGDQYVGRDPKFGYWRDTHLRLTGTAVYQLQAYFILDWNATDLKHQISYDGQAQRYFPLVQKHGDTSMQVVTSGPDSDDHLIKMGYIRLIQLAQKTCWIQTPYLIPDDSMFDAIKIAAAAGIDVRIMVPCKPDHAFVYRATQYYARQLADAGVKIYYYENGFIHAKTMVVDGKIASVGSANLDFRSFKLNFEANAFIYDRQLAHELFVQYQKDIEQSSLQKPSDFDKESRWLNFKQHFSRLLAPIL